MGEWRLFPEGSVPECTTEDWYRDRPHAPHLEEENHRPRLMIAAGLVATAAMAGGLRTVVDLGSGDGGLLSLLGPAMVGWGYDLMPANLAAAKERGVDVRYADVLNEPIDWGEIAVCTELFEHLVDPHAFARLIGKERPRALVCSSPWQERPGTAYEYHTWAWDFDGYRALVEQAGFTVQRHRTVGAAQLILAVKP